MSSNIESARELVRRDIAVAPAPRGAKRPVIDEWQNLRLTEPELPRYFTNGQNVCILTGAPSGGLLDVDLDSTEARHLAGTFLPMTAMRHGRRSAPLSHWWYRGTGNLPRRVPFKDPKESNDERAMLLEIRGTGHQTIAPRSIHPSGEIIEWHSGAIGEPAQIDAEELHRHAGYLAACSLLARYWPAQGMRDELARDLAGALARAGWSPEDIDTFIVRAADCAGDEEARQRAKGQFAVRKLQRGEQMTGWPTVAKTLGDPVVDKMREWLGIRNLTLLDGGKGSIPTHPKSGGSLPAFNLTDSGNAELFASLYGDRLRYDRARKVWRIWRGHWWGEDTTGEVERWALESARRRYLAAAEISNLKEREAAAKWAIASESRAKREACLALATAEHPIADSGDGWDADPYLLGVANGVVSLISGEVQPGRPEERITVHTDVPYDPDAAAPRWEQFLTEVFNGDRELIDFIQRAAGYSLTGDTSEQCLILPYGIGSNGKSTFLEGIRHAAGGHAYDIPFSALEYNPRQGGASNDVASLAGKRLVTAVETNEGVRLNEARVKALTGGDPMTARFLYQEHFTFRPVAKFWLAVNHKPRVQDDSYGFWRRVRLIPFTQQFTGSAVDKQLEGKLKAEAPGILAWMVRGALEWQRRGLEPPASVTAATDEYRTESDPLADFLTDRCEQDPSLSAAAGEVYKAYKAWAEDQGIREREQLTSASFGRRLGERFERKRKGSGKVYQGLGLRNTDSRG